MPRRLTNPRRQASLHADAALNHIHTSTTTASSLAPRIHSTVAITKSNTPTRASGLSNVLKLSKIQNGPQYLQKPLKPQGKKFFQGLIFQYFQGSGTVNSKMGIWLFEGLNFQKYSKFQVFMGWGTFQGNIKSKDSQSQAKKFQSFEGTQGFQSSQGPQGLKGLTLECLHLSIHLCTAFYS